MILSDIAFHGKLSIFLFRFVQFPWMSLTHKRNAHHSRFFFSLPCFANFYFCYATLAENYQRERSWRFLSLFYLSSESAHAFIREFPNKEVYIIFCWCCDVTLGQFELSKEAAIIFWFECFVFLNFFVFLYFIQDRTRNEKKWKKKRTLRLTLLRSNLYGSLRFNDGDFL